MTWQIFAFACGLGLLVLRLVPWPRPQRFRPTWPQVLLIALGMLLSIVPGFMETEAGALVRVARVIAPVLVTGGLLAYLVKVRRTDAAVHLVAIVLMLSGCGGQPSGVTPVAIQWQRFYWANAVSVPDSFRQVAMLVRDEPAPGRNGRWLQLDLAGSGTMPDGYPVAAPRPVERMHGLLAQAARFSVDTGGPEAEPLDGREVGTIGLPNYEHAPLIIDLAALRLGTPMTRDFDLATFPGIRGSAPVRFGVLEAGLQFTLTVGPGAPIRAMLDTGLSPFPVWTTREKWRALTGLLDHGPGAKQYTIRGNTGTMRFIGAPIRNSLRLGSLRLPATEAVFLDSGPPGAALEEWPIGVEALVSAQALAGRGWLILDTPRRRMLIRPL